MPCVNHGDMAGMLLDRQKGTIDFVYNGNVKGTFQHDTLKTAQLYPTLIVMQNVKVRLHRCVRANSRDGCVLAAKLSAQT